MGTNPVLTGSKRIWRYAVFGLLAASLCVIALLQPALTANAQTLSLSVIPITWNIVGLDAVDPTAGPARYLSGVRVCASGADAPDLEVVHLWTNSNSYINLTSSATQSLNNLPAGECHDFYFEVTVTQDFAALNATRQFSVTATSGSSSATNQYPLEVFVQGMAENATLHTDSLTGPSVVTVGTSVEYVAEVSADQEFGSLVYSLTFPPALLELQSVIAVYTGQDMENNSIWENACVWQDDPTDPDYNTCTGTDVISGTAVVTYTFDVVAAGTGSIFPTVFGYTTSGSNGSYLYASDFGADVLPITAQDLATPTATTTSAVTPSPTVTGTSGTPGTTATLTPTRTGTGATLTPTLTGTITPNPNATKSVSPTAAGVGQYVTFTIRVSNSGSSPAENVVVTDSFNSYTYLDIDTITTSQGSYNIVGRVATITIGTVLPRQVVTVSIRLRVNSTAVGTLNPCNTASITFTGGTRSSNQMCFRVNGGTTLPGTGEEPIRLPTESASVPLIIASAVLGLAGLAALRLAIWAWKNQKSALRWYLVSGSLLTLTAVILGACSLGNETPSTEVAIDMGDGGLSVEVSTATATVNPLAIMPAYMFATPGPIETLPSYPIPTPDITTATPLPGGGDEVDATAIERIVIQAINVDNIVAFIPFDGHTWPIQGLRQEVAWMGDTSWPGLGGNTALAGHVTVRGEGDGPFRFLYDLEIGDTVEVYTEKNVYTYEVNYKVAVEEADLTIVSQTENAQLTLITCVDWDQNLGLYLRRYAVVANLVSVAPIQVMGQSR